MKEEALHLLALTRTKGIGVAWSKNLLRRFGDAKAVFQASPGALLQSGLPAESAHAIHSFTDWASVEAELLYLEKIGARPLFFTDSEYPQRLLPLDDAPLLLFYKGNADLNTKKIVSVVGTRIVWPVPSTKRVVVAEPAGGEPSSIPATNPKNSKTKSVVPITNDRTGCSNPP